MVPVIVPLLAWAKAPTEMKEKIAKRVNKDRMKPSCYEKETK
jgi:hypothetical protein